jgi:hypothetical protein
MSINSSNASEVVLDSNVSKSSPRVLGECSAPVQALLKVVADNCDKAINLTELCNLLITQIVKDFQFTRTEAGTSVSGYLKIRKLLGELSGRTDLPLLTRQHFSSLEVVSNVVHLPIKEPDFVPDTHNMEEHARKLLEELSTIKTSQVVVADSDLAPKVEIVAPNNPAKLNDAELASLKKQITAYKPTLEKTKPTNTTLELLSLNGQLYVAVFNVYIKRSKNETDAENYYSRYIVYENNKRYIGIDVPKGVIHVKGMFTRLVIPSEYCTWQYLVNVLVHRPGMQIKVYTERESLSAETKGQYNECTFVCTETGLEQIL